MFNVLSMTYLVIKIQGKMHVDVNRLGQKKFGDFKELP